MPTTIAVSDDTRDRLMRLKLEEGSKSLDELLQKILVEYRKSRFLEAAGLFQKRVEQSGVRFEDLVE